MKKYRYFAKKDTWYDEGTEAFLLCLYTEGTLNDPGHGGLFSGTKNGKLDEEGCGFDEFTVEEVLSEASDEKI